MATISQLGSARPPYVEFETRAVEDRNATIEAGHIVLKDVDYAIIRALGSKDTVEKVAGDWLEHIEKEARRGAYPREWAKFFREQYEDWKGGNETQKVNGLHVRHWAAISRAQAEGLISAGVFTVEDLAAANEECLRRIGMGGRALQQRAVEWLESAKTNGAAEQVAALKQENADLKDRITELNKRMDKLVSALEAQQPKRGKSEAA